MVLREALRQAIRTLLAHRLRAFLTLFGVLWGTAAVVFLVSWGAGVRVMLDEGFSKLGKNMVMAWAGKIGEDFTPAVDRRSLWFTREDVRAVRARARIPDLVGGESQRRSAVSFRQKTLSMDVRGTEPEVAQIRGVRLATGRGISRSDVNGRKRVAVLGSRAREKLLGPLGFVGTHIRIRGLPFEVVGILAPLGTQLARDGDEIDDQVWIPITALFAFGKRWGMDEDVVDNLLFRVPSRKLLEPAQSEVRAILAERLRVPASDKEAVGMFSPVGFLKQFNLEEMDGVLLILAIGTLLIGAVGVVTMMLDSVQERRSEIGVRLAVGARRRAVIAQFFWEAFTLTSLGGLTGLATGIAACSLLGRLQVPDLIPVPILQWDVVVVALVIVVLAGLFAGVVPAWRASKIDPAQTLRMD
jgi:putative ABC transport system permease protein